MPNAQYDRAAHLKLRNKIPSRQYAQAAISASSTTTPTHTHTHPPVCFVCGAQLFSRSSVDCQLPFSHLSYPQTCIRIQFGALCWLFTVYFVINKISRILHWYTDECNVKQPTTIIQSISSSTRSPFVLIRQISLFSYIVCMHRMEIKFVLSVLFLIRILSNIDIRIPARRLRSVCVCYTLY